MNTPSMYGAEFAEEVDEKLFKIAQLAKIGAASTDSKLGIMDMDCAQLCLFEVIHRLATEAWTLSESVN